jgi:hypothetical protein
MTGAVIFDSELKLYHHRSGADQLLDIVVGYSLVVDVTVDGLYTSLARNTFMIGKGGHDGSIKAGIDASCHLQQLHDGTDWTTQCRDRVSASWRDGCDVCRKGRHSNAVDLHPIAIQFDGGHRWRCAERRE